MKKRVLALVLAAGLIASSCVGVNSQPEPMSFPAMHAVKDWNVTATRSDLANQGVFVVSLPAYAIAAMLDLVIFNSIEFWSAD